MYNLKVEFQCPSSFSISWRAPANFNFRDSFCVSIIDVNRTTESDVVHAKCGIVSTTYFLETAFEDNMFDCGHDHNVSVYAVNLAGNGPATSALLTVRQGKVKGEVRRKMGDMHMPGACIATYWPGSKDKALSNFCH